MKNTTNVVFRDSPETKNDIDDRVKKEKRNPSHPCFSRDSAPCGRAIPAPLRGKKECFSSLLLQGSIRSEATKSPSRGRGFRGRVT